MGIKKNVFLRDLVRTKVAFDKSYMMKLYNELKPLHDKYKGNPDAAVDYVMAHSSLFPTLINIPVKEEEIRTLISLYFSRKTNAPGGHPRDILEEGRADRPPIPREADSISQVRARAPEHTDFFLYLNSERPNIYSQLSDEDIKEISNILETYMGSVPAATAKIYTVFVKAYLRNTFKNAESVLERIKMMGAVPSTVTPRHASMYNVLFSYLDTLDRGF